MDQSVKQEASEVIKVPVSAITVDRSKPIRGSSGGIGERIMTIYRRDDLTEEEQDDRVKRLLRAEPEVVSVNNPEYQYQTHLVPLEWITVIRDERIRAELKEIPELAADICDHGLLHPIAVDGKGKLISGERRLEAVRSLGWKAIPSRILVHCCQPWERFLIEYRENKQRMNFSLADDIRAAQILEPIIRESIRSLRKSKYAQPSMSDSDIEVAPMPDSGIEGGSDVDMGILVKEGETTREALAREIGIGRDRLERAMKLVEVAKTDPEIALIAAKMLDDENVNAAWEAYRAVLEARKPTVPETPFDDPEDDTDEPDDAGEESDSPELSGSVGKSDGRRADERPAKKVKGKGKSAAPAATAAPDAPALELSQPVPDSVPAPASAQDDATPVSRARALEIYSAAEYIEFCDELMHFLAKPQQQKVVQYYRELYGPAAPKAQEPPEPPADGPPPEEPPSPAPTTPAEVATQLRSNIEGLPKKHRKDAVVASAIVLSELGKKPTVYLPRLPDEHGDAIGQIQEEITARVTALNQFAGWDLNGRQTTARQLVKTMQAKAMSVKKICGIESMEDIQQPELFDTKWPEHLDKPEVRAVWEIWLANRKRRKLPVDAAVMEKQIRNLSILDAEQAVEVITSAHENNWHGIREDVCKKNWCNRAPGGAGTEKRPSPKQVIEREKELLEERKAKLKGRVDVAIKLHTPKLQDYSSKATSLNAAYHAAKLCKDHIAKDLMMPEDMQRMLETDLMIIARKAFFSTHPEQEPKD